MKLISLLIFLILEIINNPILINSQQINHNSNLYTPFSPIYNYDISAADETGILLETTSQNSIYDCFKKCSKISNCLMISFKVNQCKLYSQVRYSVSISIAPCLFEKKILDYSSINAYLTNHWPFNNDLKDIVSGADLYGGTNFGFATDRLNNQLSTLYLNQGFLRAPTGIYFKGEFTISAWVKPFNVANYARLLDFGPNNVVLAFSWNYLNPYVCCPHNVMSNKLLQMGKWYHFAYSMSSTSAILYVNGEKWIETSANGLPSSTTRTSNYIGRSNWDGNAKEITAYIDDLKIFNKSLTYAEVMKVLNSYY
jgi:hypothetical protein